MLDAVAVAQNNKRLGPGSSASGLLTDPKPIPKTNSQTLNLDVPAITNLNLIPSVPVLPRPPYRFHPGVYKRYTENSPFDQSTAHWPDNEVVPKLVRSEAEPHFRQKRHGKILHSARTTVARSIGHF